MYFFAVPSFFLQNLPYLCSQNDVMRILFVNTSELTGGAAVATSRLMRALRKSGESAAMVVRDKTSDDGDVLSLPGRWSARWHFLWERLVVFLHLRLHKEHLWEIDIANSGADITQLPAFKNADVVHLAWINQGMLSLQGIRRILASGKPVVWTLHDLWPVSGICHYARGCGKFSHGCGDCPLLPGGGGSKDLSNKVWLRKKDVYQSGNISLVTCSEWLGNQARQSGLAQGIDVSTIPNPIDTSVFCPSDKARARAALGLPQDKKVILFVAQKVTDERKGASYLVSALDKLRSLHPEVAEETVVALLGGHSDDLASQISLPVYPLGYVSGDALLSRVYNAADVFVLPSMEDNLPNTIMEALACGVPCVGFRVGGIPEMIDDRISGYVACAGSSDDLAEGLFWVLSEADHEALSKSAVAKVMECYSEEAVARRYINVYRRALARQHGSGRTENSF